MGNFIVSDRPFRSLQYFTKDDALKRELFNIESFLKRNDENFNGFEFGRSTGNGFLLAGRFKFDGGMPIILVTHFDELNLIELADRIIDSVIHYERADLDGN